MTLNEQMEILISYGIANQEEIQLVMEINGRSENTINDIIYARTGYRDIEQYLEGEY